MIIKYTSVHQILIFKNDEIPFWHLAEGAAVEAFGSLFKFTNLSVALQSPPARPAVTAQMGSLQEESSRIPIKRLVVEDRRILLDVEGTSDDADKVVTRVRSFLSDLFGNHDPESLVPIICSQESEVIARLEFDPNSLIAPPLRRFMQSEATNEVQYTFAQGTIALAQLVFDVTYRDEGTILEERRVSLSRKQFVIGPREGSTPEERLYYSKAPIRTQAHLRLLKELEEQLSQST